MSVNSVSGSNAVTAKTATEIARSENSVAAQKDQFLQLMLAQMKNQDPLNPMDGAEYASQMAQFSTVEGIQQMSKLQEQNNVLLDTMMTLDSSSLVDTEVSIPVTEISLSETETLKGFTDLQTSGEEVTVFVRNSDGSIAKEVVMGSQKAGRMEFEVPDLGPGEYSIEIAVKNGDTTLTSTAFLERTVEKVSIPGNGGSLNLDISGVGIMPLYSINEFLGGKV